MIDTDAPAPADPAAVAAFRQAQSAARGAALAGLILGGFTLWWIAWVASKGWSVPAHVAADPEGRAWFAAELHPLIVSSDTRIALPTPLGFALVLLGPFLALIASVALWVRIRRDAARGVRALALLAGGCAFSVVPGLMMQIGFQTRTSHGSGGAGLGPAPMCGGLTLLIAAYAAWVLLHHGPVLRAGAPPDLDPG